jgi:hypothetical protein
LGPESYFCAHAAKLRQIKKADDDMFANIVRFPDTQFLALLRAADR